MHQTSAVVRASHEAGAGGRCAFVQALPLQDLIYPSGPVPRPGTVSGAVDMDCAGAIRVALRNEAAVRRAIGLGISLRLFLWTTKAERAAKERKKLQAR